MPPPPPHRLLQKSWAILPTRAGPLVLEYLFVAVLLKTQLSHAHFREKYL
jgi:hypothetical protein